MDLIFDPKATREHVASVLRRFVEGPIAVAGAAAAIGFFLYEDLRAENLSHFIIFLTLLLFSFLIVRVFIAERLEAENQPPLSKRNGANLLSRDILAGLSSHTKTAYDILAAAVASERGRFIRREMGIVEKQLLETVAPMLKEEQVLPFLEEALKTRNRLNTVSIDPGCIFLTIFSRKGIFEEMLNALDLSVHDLEMIIRWEEYHHAVWKKPSPWSPGELVRVFGGVGRRWVSGFNEELDRMTRNISQTILYTPKPKVVIHLQQMQDALHILGRSTQHNLIVTGDSGSGKRSFIRNLAYHLRITELKGGFSYTNVLVLRAENLLSGTRDPDTFLLSALQRANRQGRYILVIENIGMFLKTGDEKVRSVLAKFLQAPNINIIGIAETGDYHRLIKANAVMDAQFEKIHLEPTNFSDTMSVLMEEYFRIEEREHMHVTYRALRAIVEFADRYIGKGAFPGKAIDLLHDTVQHAHEGKNRYVTPEDVTAMVSLRAHMNVAGADEHEKEILKNLAEEMDKEVIGQHAAVVALSNALKRARADVSSKTRPIGTFLFLGPTGVGKTETAKVLAEKYFGSADAMVRLDMNEYGTPNAVSAIIGSVDPSEQSEGFLTKAVQDRPFSLVLLDEIEKADRKVLNLFLQILDEGTLIDGQGRHTDFRNTIIIATSNAGAAFIRGFLQEHPDSTALDFKKVLLDDIIKEGSFSPEFVNRFDDVILYSPLSREDAVKVAEKMVSSIVEEISDARGIRVDVTPDALAAIAEHGYSTEFGAREMRRTITDTLETYLADYLLTHTIHRGGEIIIQREDLKL